MRRKGEVKCVAWRRVERRGIFGVGEGWRTEWGVWGVVRVVGGFEMLWSIIVGWFTMTL